MVSFPGTGIRNMKIVDVIQLPFWSPRKKILPFLSHCQFYSLESSNSSHLAFLQQGEMTLGQLFQLQPLDSVFVDVCLHRTCLVWLVLLLSANLRGQSGLISFFFCDMYVCIYQYIRMPNIYVRTCNIQNILIRFLTGNLFVYVRTFL